MKKNTLIVVVLIGGIVLGGLGFYCGLSYAKKEIIKTKIESPLSNLLFSKVINGLTAVAVGQIKEISSRNLVLTVDGSDLTVFIKEDASIGRLFLAEQNTKVPQTMSREDIKFEDMKVGDNVNISCNLKADLSLEGISVNVLP